MAEGQTGNTVDVVSGAATSQLEAMMDREDMVDAHAWRIAERACSGKCGEALIAYEIEALVNLEIKRVKAAFWSEHQCQQQRQCQCPACLGYER